MDGSFFLLFDVGFCHFCAGGFSGTTAIYWRLSRTGNIGHRAALIIHADLNRCNLTTTGTFGYCEHAANYRLNQGKQDSTCASVLPFSGFFPCSANNRRLLFPKTDTAFNNLGDLRL
jgi:hypothetical protein